MPRYIRAKQAGGTFFFTVVTYRRRPIFYAAENRRRLSQTIMEVQSVLPFTLDGWVLLPEHLHYIWTLPQGDANFSKRWGLIKAKFSSQLNPPRRPVWQKRFWEHLIRNEGRRAGKRSASRLKGAGGPGEQLGCRPPEFSVAIPR